MADAAGEAAATLRGLLGARNELVRLGAARAILELGVRLREAGELAERIAILEDSRTAGVDTRTQRIRGTMMRDELNRYVETLEVVATSRGGQDG